MRIQIYGPLVIFLVVASAFGQNMSGMRDIPIPTWQAPAYWDASSVPAEKADLTKVAEARNTNSAVSGSPLTGSMAFVGIVPCRLVDTRGTTGETGAFGPPIMSAGQVRTIPVL